MLYALIDGTRYLATPERRGLAASCSQCGGEVICKCGEIKIWHWSHRAYFSCGHEPETAWHLSWKLEFPADCVEIVIGQNRADVCIGGCILEFQHSPISTEEIIRRRRAYGERLVWVFDAAQFHIQLRDRGSHWTFIWRWAHRSLEGVDLEVSKLFFDLGEGRLLEVRRIHWDGRVAGWGLLFTKDDFLAWLTAREKDVA